MQRVPAAIRRQWRWVLMGAAIVTLLALPAVVNALPADPSGISTDELVSRIMASADQPYDGYAEGRGGLRLPELPGAADLSTLISDTSKTRVWYAGPEQWRTDLLYSGGERDRYRTPEGMWLWDSGVHRSAFLDTDTQLRLPIPSDLTPPELGRRLVAAAQPEEITSIGPRRVAGHDADGLRITPASKESTIGTIDLWADSVTGLPVRIEVTAKGRSRSSLESGFLELELQPPDPDLLSFEPPPGSRRHRADDDLLDLVQAIELYANTKLPDTLGGLSRRTEEASATATYGEGFDVVGVLALPEQFVTDTLRALPTSERPWGQTAAVVRTALINGMIFVVDGTAYIVGGPVSMAQLDRVAADLAGVPS